MEVQHIALAISIANFVLTWGVALYMYLANKNKVTNGRIDTLTTELNTKIEDLEVDMTKKIAAIDDDFEERLDKHSEDLVGLRKGAEHGPTHHDLGQLHEKINAVDVKVSAQGGALAAIDASLRQLTSEITKRGLS
jgi:hypothetical protein